MKTPQKQANQVDKLFTFIKELNIYILNKSCHANLLIQNHLGTKVQSQEKKSLWYVHPEETLYFVSVHEQFEEENQRRQSIRDVYKNCKKAANIDILHFYLNLRKRNKFLSRLLKYSYQQITQKQSSQHKHSPFFNVYECHQDYKNQQNHRVFYLVNSKQKIIETIFYPEYEQIKMKYTNGKVFLCIFENNDFTVSIID